MNEGIVTGEANKEAEIIIKFHKRGKTPEQIADELEIPIEKVKQAISSI